MILRYTYLNLLLNIQYTVITLPGANLHRIATVAAEALDNNFSFHLTIIAGGIKDISMSRHIPSRHARPRFNSVEVLVNYTVDEMRRCTHYVKDHSYMPVALATLGGMCLSQYSLNLCQFLFTYQPTVDCAITQINYRVRGINRMSSLHSPTSHQQSTDGVISISLYYYHMYWTDLGSWSTKSWDLNLYLVARRQMDFLNGGFNINEPILLGFFDLLFLLHGNKGFSPREFPS